MNIGKIFEDEFKKSVPANCFYYRFRDGTAAYSKDSNMRFQAKNICDCMVMSLDILYFFELKNTNGTSLPFSNIKANQLESLSNIEHPKIKGYFVICFRDKERCFCVEAKRLKEFTEQAERKSIPLVWCENNGIELKMIKKRIRYKYNLSEFLENRRG